MNEDFFIYYRPPCGVLHCTAKGGRFFLTSSLLWVKQNATRRVSYQKLDEYLFDDAEDQ